MKNCKFALLAGIVGAALAAPASAQFYLGAGVGQSSSKFNTTDFGLGSALVNETQDKSKTAIKIYGGYDFTKNWAIEGGATRLEKPQYRYSGTGALAVGTRAQVEETAWHVALKGTASLSEQVGVFGKFGVTRNRSNLELPRTGNAAFNALLRLPNSAGKSHANALYGAGAEYSATKNIGLRLEYERYGTFGDTNTGRTKVDLWSLGATYRF